MSNALSPEMSRRSESSVTMRPILFHINKSLNMSFPFHFDCFLEFQAGFNYLLV